MILFPYPALALEDRSMKILKNTAHAVRGLWEVVAMSISSWKFLCLGLQL